MISILWIVDVTLKQVFPMEGDPICLGDKLVYECTVDNSSLRWRYTNQDASSFIFFSDDFGLINEARFLGPFDIVLVDIITNGSTVRLLSTATLSSGLMLDAVNQPISCLTADQQEDYISIMVSGMF